MKRSGPAEQEAEGEYLHRAHYEALVIGSGFGGAVAACRLAQAGVDVAIAERGRRWPPGSFPRDVSGLDDGWLWLCDHGLYDARPLNDILAVQAAGFGGGSLVYANVAIRRPDEVFDAAWPDAYSRDLALAERHGAAVGVRTEAVHLSRTDDGYRVRLREHGHEGAGRDGVERDVFVCAGAVGTTELLLRSRTSTAHCRTCPPPSGAATLATASSSPSAAVCANASSRRVDRSSPRPR